MESVFGVDFKIGACLIDIFHEDFVPLDVYAFLVSVCPERHHKEDFSQVADQKTAILGVLLIAMRGYVYLLQLLFREYQLDGIVFHLVNEIFQIEILVMSAGELKIQRIKPQIIQRAVCRKTQRRTITQ